MSAGLGKRFSKGPAGVKLPAFARIRRKKTRNKKIRGEGYLCSKSKTGECPVKPVC